MVVSCTCCSHGAIVFELQYISYIILVLTSLTCGGTYLKPYYVSLPIFILLFSLITKMLCVCCMCFEKASYLYVVLLQLICRLGGNLQQHQYIPTHMLDGQPDTSLLIHIYALHAMTPIFSFLEKSCCTRRYLDFLQDYIFLTSVRTLS